MRHADVGVEDGGQPARADLDQAGLAAARIHHLLLAPPAELPQAGRQVAGELAQRAPLGDGAVHLGAHGLQHVEARRLGEGELRQVLLGGHVAPVEGPVPVLPVALGAETADGLLVGKVSRMPRAAPAAP